MAFPLVPAIARFLSASITATGDLTPPEFGLTAAELAVDLAALVWIRTITRRPLRARPAQVDYDEAA